MNTFVEHEHWMREALALARRGQGLTRPNPPVGAVIVKNGHAVGRGWHSRAGGPHAEIKALRQAGLKAKGATLYVTLEPCSTFGRTPPCTDAVLQAGISRVVAAMRDPNPRHCGKGLRILRRKGVEVLLGPCSDQAQAMLAPFKMRMACGRPWITLKLGVSLDARIADQAGLSRWITGAAARREVQRLRRSADAILVGSGTLIADNPSLLPRPRAGRKPFRVVVDAGGRVPCAARVLNDEMRHQTVVATTARCSKKQRNAWLGTGAQVWVLPESARGVLLSALFERMAEEGLLHVLCEGGGELAASLFHARLVDECCFFVAPVLLGGTGKPALAGSGWKLGAAPRLRWLECRRIGPDFMIRATPEYSRQAVNKNSNQRVLPCLPV